jgi:hypothetical protein
MCIITSIIKTLSTNFNGHEPMMKKTLIASALVGLFASTAVIANDDTE